MQIWAQVHMHINNYTDSVTYTHTYAHLVSVLLFTGCTEGNLYIRADGEIMHRRIDGWTNGLTN